MVPALSTMIRRSPSPSSNAQVGVMRAHPFGQKLGWSPTPALMLRIGRNADRDDIAPSSWNTGGATW
jgi:hypothetical protein